VTSSKHEVTDEMSDMFNLCALTYYCVAPTVAAGCLLLLR